MDVIVKHLAKRYFVRWYCDGIWFSRYNFIYCWILVVGI